MSKLTVLSVLLMLTAWSCIDPFQPQIDESQDLVVINGRITDKPGGYTAEISRTAPYNDPGFKPIEDCTVRVEDDAGARVQYDNYGQGRYGAMLDKPFLAVNKAYRMVVTLQDGTEYRSAFDSLLPCAQIDSLYYRLETVGTEDPERNLYGIRFYIDVDGNEAASGNYLWQLAETYEYHATYLVQYIVEDDQVYDFTPYTDSLYVCYKSGNIREIFTTSTRDLTTNRLTAYPLNFVSNESVRLRHAYSLLVSQFSLSSQAYTYWDKIRNQQTGTGSLYDKQPSGSGGNFSNAADPEETVLGYFYASQVTQKRIMVREQFDFPIYHYNCRLDSVYYLEGLGPGAHYLESISMSGVGPPYGTSDPPCFNCLLRGGTTEKPDYWDDL